MKEVWTWLASLMGVMAFIQPLLHAFFPAELRLAAARRSDRIVAFFLPYCYFDITEIDGVNTNELYNAVRLYLSSFASAAGSRLTLSRQPNSSSFTFGISNNDRILDTFRGARVAWEHVVTQRLSQSFSFRPVPDEKRGFTLRIRKKDKALILDAYLDHIMARAAEIRRRTQDRRLYTNSRGGSLNSPGQPWECVPFKHPSTFDTLAMDPARKEEIKADLRGFADGEAFYQKTGRAWKRGYLLYGPPGTGKSSLIAAIANYLGYDIYDLELTEVHTNSELRKLLMKTTSKSIIVIEDIDCSVNLTNRGNKPKPPAVARDNAGGPDPAGTGEDGNGNSMTLSGLLNFTDGLWSCCGSERIFVFTTNHIEKLDPALLRCGRMDMHIFMSYCSFPALEILVRNYLGAEVGELGVAEEVAAVIDEAQMTPADISEVLIKNRMDRGRAAAELLAALRERAARRGQEKEASVEEEEQEKRALDVPPIGGGGGCDEEVVEDKWNVAGQGGHGREVVEGT